MDIQKVLTQLRQEKDFLERLIKVAEDYNRIIAGKGKRRGRPPGSKNQLAAPSKPC